MAKSKKTNPVVHSDYDIFIKGETVDLCVPSDDKWIIDKWFRWFNREEVTAYLSQGLYPNTLKSQKAFYDSLENNNSRIVLLIKPKDYDGFVGVTSLSSINLVHRRCDFALVIAEKLNTSGSMYYGLETKALMTQHAIEKLGLERINSSQIIDLVKWQNWQILLGYQVEGLLRNKFRKGNKTFDVLVSSCLLKDYNKIIKIRGGKLWPGKSKFLELIQNLPKNSLINEMLTWFPQKQKAYWNKVFSPRKQ